MTPSPHGSGMVKMVFCLRRKPELSRDEFLSYWHDGHAPLVKKTLEPFGLRRYVLVTTLATPLQDALAESRGTPPAYDGLAELWFDSLEAMVEGMSTEQGQVASALLLEDENRFIDFSSSPLFLTEERVVAD